MNSAAFQVPSSYTPGNINEAYKQLVSKKRGFECATAIWQSRPFLFHSKRRDSLRLDFLCRAQCRGHFNLRNNRRRFTNY